MSWVCLRCGYINEDDKNTECLRCDKTQPYRYDDVMYGTEPAERIGLPGAVKITLGELSEDEDIPDNTDRTMDSDEPEVSLEYKEEEEKERIDGPNIPGDTIEEDEPGEIDAPALPTELMEEKEITESEESGEEPVEEEPSLWGWVSEEADGEEATEPEMNEDEDADEEDEGEGDDDQDNEEVNIESLSDEEDEGDDDQDNEEVNIESLSDEDEENIGFESVSTDIFDTDISDDTPEGSEMGSDGEDLPEPPDESDDGGNETEETSLDLDWGDEEDDEDEDNDEGEEEKGMDPETESDVGGTGSCPECGRVVEAQWSRCGFCGAALHE